ncbi:MAG TPA: PRC-barrel domain-containing protein [Chloroflexota bacterium]|nr:PRC-barrel domain-containing protein [Chloroflexota bacterium]
MATIGTASLHKLSDSKLTVADNAEDIRGRKVLDQAGAEVGSVDDLMIDDRESRVRFLLVASGGFLGLGETTFLIPVDAITTVTADAVYIDHTREHVAVGPGYNPEMVVDTDHLDSVYNHYGYRPYWATKNVDSPDSSRVVQGDLPEKTDSRDRSWCFDDQIPSFSAGQPFRVETLAPAVVHWSADEWHTVHDAPTRDSSREVHLTDLPTSDLPAGATVRFTFFWTEANRWEGNDFAVQVAGPDQRGSLLVV